MEKFNWTILEHCKGKYADNDLKLFSLYTQKYKTGKKCYETFITINSIEK